MDKLERVDAAQLVRPDLRINFSVDKTPGKIIATIKNIRKSFGENIILTNGNAEINSLELMEKVSQLYYAF